LKKALIIGVSGQDGAYLAKLLLEKGYEVHGTSRDHEVGTFRNLEKLGIKDRVKLASMVTSDFRSVLTALQKAEADEIYNLAGQTSVGMSFAYPVETFDSILIGTMNLLECIRLLKHPVKFYNAGSSEVFGNTPVPATETTPYHPRSPYATAKAAAHYAVTNYREAYGLFAALGFSSTTSHRCAPRASSQARLFPPPSALHSGRARSSFLATQIYVGTGAGLQTM
jgi:GDPmannose 4,6-dehydratase